MHCASCHENATRMPPHGRFNGSVHSALCRCNIAQLAFHTAVMNQTRQRPQLEICCEWSCRAVPDLTQKAPSGSGRPLVLRTRSLPVLAGSMKAWALAVLATGAMEAMEAMTGKKVGSRRE